MELKDTASGSTEGLTDEVMGWWGDRKARKEKEEQEAEQEAEEAWKKTKPWKKVLWVLLFVAFWLGVIILGDFLGIDLNPYPH